MTPIIYTTQEDPSFLKDMTARIKDSLPSRDASFLLNYPVVYIHFWPGNSIEFSDKEGKVFTKQGYNVYIGESNDVVHRTRQHYEDGQKINNWVQHLKNDKQVAEIVIIGHPHFNKSFTLDMENRLIDYMAPCDNITLFNARGNPQNGYYPIEDFNPVFNSVWKKLRRINNNIFLSLSEIERSAFFKASPLKKLSEDQINAKEEILARIQEAIDTKKDGQLIFVQGEAGTGKTVLNSALFYELVTRGEELFGLDKQLDCHLMVNHDQQLHVYQQICKRLDLGEDNVHKPTSFINKYSEDNKVDISFIDEGHLLLTQGKQSYRGHNQLDDIMRRSRVTVLMFDEYQVLTAEEYWEPEVLEHFKDISRSQHNMLALSQQLRMNCSASTLEWIRSFVEFRKLLPFTKDASYEVRTFDTPEQLQRAIKKCAETDPLSRMVATYDWPYIREKRPDDGGKWSVKIEGWSLPWNYETELDLSRKARRANSSKAWAEQPHTIDEVGSTFTIQGFDLSYVGVILGPSVKYRDGEIVFDPSESHNNKAKQRRTLKDGSKISFGETFIRNEVKVLLTRGVKGLYIYACDKSLREALKTIAGV